ncbi:hypothetical protein HMPREF0731_0006, partial [Pseudoroseomonas cervicalis ATCC 49957]
MCRGQGEGICRRRRRATACRAGGDIHADAGDAAAAGTPWRGDAAGPGGGPCR